MDEAQVHRMIAEAMGKLEAEHQRQSGLLAKTVSQQLDEKWQRNLQDIGANLHVFQSAQTVMWKEQVQNQQLVGALMQQAGLTYPARP